MTDPTAAPAALAAALAPEAGPPAQIGRGLWGPAFDLGDGTVIKLVAHRAGIGAGTDIAAAEAAALQEMATFHPDGWAVPRLVAHGALARDTDWAAWLRMTRLPGRPATEADLPQLVPDLARALADLHAHGPTTEPVGATVSPPLQGLHCIRARGDNQDKARCRVLAARLARLLADAPLVRVHADLHPGNILVSDAPDGRLRFEGLVDWAVSHVGPPEAEIASLANHPAAAAALGTAYEDLTGTALDPDLIRILSAANALFAAVIERGLGDLSAECASRALLGQLMQPH